MTVEQNPKLLKQVCSNTGASRVVGSQLVQTLWSGYGQIIRLNLEYDETLHHGGVSSVIIKYIQPPVEAQHPRGWNTDASMQRKLESYRVEAHWYNHYVESARGICTMPELLASYSSDNQTWLILEDLDLNYPIRHEHLNIDRCKACLRWLARFHGHHFQSEGVGLWDTGSYWYLQTRQDELNAMAEGALKKAAVSLDAKLENCQFKTLVHGDAKVANVCFSQNSQDVAMVDFQYVGRGCGMRDVAYFLGSALTESECKQYASNLLDVYFAELHTHIPATQQKAVETEWRGLYATAWADFHRFLEGWMPGHYKIHGYTKLMTEQALAEL